MLNLGGLEVLTVGNGDHSCNDSSHFSWAIFLLTCLSRMFIYIFKTPEASKVHCGSLNFLFHTTLWPGDRTQVEALWPDDTYPSNQGDK